MGEGKVIRSWVSGGLKGWKELYKVFMVFLIGWDGLKYVVVGDGGCGKEEWMK